jgi:hypothetical protein
MVKSSNPQIMSENMPTDEPNNPSVSARQAPRVTLTAIGSKRKIDLRRTGTLTLLVCHGQETADEATQVHTAVRERYPLSSTLLAASLVNLKIVPRMFRGIAETAIRKAYQDATLKLKDGQQPEEYIVILPDWDGGVTTSLDLRNTTSAAGVAILDGEGNVLETFQGANLASTTVSLLEKYVA